MSNDGRGSVVHDSECESRKNLDHFEGVTYCANCGGSAPSLNIPDRQFLDDHGRRWEWCGGEPGTWAWRITALPHHLNVLLKRADDLYDSDYDTLDYEPGWLKKEKHGPE